MNIINLEILIDIQKQNICKKTLLHELSILELLARDIGVECYECKYIAEILFEEESFSTYTELLKKLKKHILTDSFNRFYIAQKQRLPMLVQFFAIVNVQQALLDISEKFSLNLSELQLISTAYYIEYLKESLVLTGLLDNSLVNFINWELYKIEKTKDLILLDLCPSIYYKFSGKYFLNHPRPFHNISNINNNDVKSVKEYLAELKSMSSNKVNNINPFSYRKIVKNSRIE